LYSGGHIGNTVKENEIYYNEENITDIVKVKEVYREEKIIIIKHLYINKNKEEHFIQKNFLKKYNLIGVEK
jgi:hypothetical protein